MATQQQRVQVCSSQKQYTGFIGSLLNGLVLAVFACIKVSVYCWSYPLSWALDLFNYVIRMGRVLLSFFVGGLQGVFRSLGVGVFGQKIHYAILKENGQYLKMANRTLEDVFTCQLYDYSIRKFLSIPNLDDDLRVTEIQFWSSTGLRYLSKNLGIQSVTALHNNTEKLNKFQTKTEGIFYKNVNYSLENEIPKQDIFLFFNRGKQRTVSYQNYVDIIKILTFIKKNMNDNGYAVVGNYFTAEGQIRVFEELIDAFGLKIQMAEDITKNILHSRKVLNRIHKNRKLAWLIGRGKEMISHLFGQFMILHSKNFVIQGIWDFLQKAAGLKQELSQYKIYILQHQQ